MAHIYADINQMNETASQLFEVINVLNGLKNSVRSVERNIPSSSILMTNMQRKVSGSVDDLMRLIIDVNNLRLTVIQAAEKYSGTENKIVSNAGGEIKRSQDAKEYGDYIDQILDTVSALIDAIRGKSKAIAKLLELILPFFAGGIIGVLNASGVESKDRENFGYIIEQDKLTAWLKKKGWSNEDGTMGVNGYVGKIEVNNKFDGAIGKLVSKKEEKNGEWEEKYQLIYGEVGAGVDASFLTGDGYVKVGDDMFGLEGGVEGGIGNARAGVNGQFSIGEDGINAYVGAEAIVSAVEGKASASINLLGFEIVLAATGYAGAAGAEAKAGLKNGKIVAEAGAAAGVGGGVSIEIGLNDLGVDTVVDSFKDTGELIKEAGETIKDGASEFIDWVTFWD